MARPRRARAAAGSRRERGRAAVAGQAQADLRAAPDDGRSRHRGKRERGDPDRKQGEPEGLLPPLGLPRQPPRALVRAADGARPAQGHRDGGEGDAPAQPARPRAVPAPASLRGPGPPARGTAHGGDGCARAQARRRRRARRRSPARHSRADCGRGGARRAPGRGGRRRRGRRDDERGCSGGDRGRSGRRRGAADRLARSPQARRARRRGRAPRDRDRTRVEQGRRGRGDRRALRGEPRGRAGGTRTSRHR